MKNRNLLHIQVPFKLESGELPELEIAYHTYGTKAEDDSNVIWVCHALTANSDAAEWWEGLIGEGKVLDPARHFIVCANIIGSCYGSSGPLSENPVTGQPYYASFPEVTIRDMARAHDLLRKHLGISKIHLTIGGSMGGYQVLEWAYLHPDVFDHLALLVTGSAESAWGKAIHTTQRMAIETDKTWRDNSNNAGKTGLETARGIGMLTYRNYAQYVATQSDAEPVLSDFKAESYIRYQGSKLAKRFNAYSYWLLTRSMDSHHLGRNRSSLKEALNRIKSKALVIGITTDFLCPVAEQKKLASGLPNAKYVEIDSPYGHDGFLIESEQISREISQFLS